MNVNMVRLTATNRELKGIRLALERLAECWESERAEQGYNMRPPRADTTGPEPELTYTDEEADWARELEEQLGHKLKDVEGED